MSAAACECAARASVECVVCGAELQLGGHARGRTRLTCTRRECCVVVQRERVRAQGRRETSVILGRVYGPEICPRCFYEANVCRCSSVTTRSRRAPSAAASDTRAGRRVMRTPPDAWARRERKRALAEAARRAARRAS